MTEKCGCLNSTVIDSRVRKDGTIYRRRVCLDCERRWSTWEVSMALLEEFKHKTYNTKDRGLPKRMQKQAEAA